MTAQMTVSVTALAGSVASLSFGQLFYKQYAVSGRRGLLALAVVLFIATTLCTFVALRQLNVGTVYMSAAASHPLVLALSALVLGERVGRGHLMATALIVAGIVLYVSGIG